MSFIKDAKDVITHAMTTGEIFEKDTKRRLDICLQCPIYNKVKSKCDKSLGGCGCNIPTKVKFAGAKCPKGFWK